MTMTMTARDVLAAGHCSPPCLLALMDHGRCDCRCGGKGHGILADVEFGWPTWVPVRIAVPTVRAMPVVIDRLKEVLQGHPGDRGRTAWLELGSSHAVAPSRELFADLARLMGPSWSGWSA